MSGTSQVPSSFSSTEVRQLLTQRGWVLAHQVPSETKATLRVVTVDGKRYCIDKKNDKTTKDKLCRVLALRLALRLRSGNLNLEYLPHLAIGGSYVLPNDPEAPDLWSYDSEEGKDAKLAFLDLRFFQGLGKDLGDGEYTCPLVRIPVRDAHGDVVTRDVYEFVRDKEGTVIDRKKVYDTDGSIRKETVYHLYAKAETKMKNGRDITVFLPPAIRLDFFFFLQLSFYLPPDWSKNCPNVMGRTFYDALMKMCVYHTGETKTHNWFVHEDHREIIDRYFDPDDPDFERADGTCDSEARNATIERAREQPPIIDQITPLKNNKGKRWTAEKCFNVVKQTPFYVQGIPEDTTAAPAAPAARAMPPILEIVDSSEESSSSDSSSEEEEECSLFDEEPENQKRIEELTMENQTAQKRIEALTAQNEAAQKTIQEKQAAQKTIQDLTVESQAAQKTIQDLMLEKQAAQKRIKALTTAQSEAADQAAASKKRKRTPRTKSQRVLDGNTKKEVKAGQLYSFYGYFFLWYGRTGGELVETNLPAKRQYVLNAEGVPACP